MARKTKRNQITSPELLSQVNPDNTRLKEDFLGYLQSVQRSKGTIAGYQNDIDIFFVWNLLYNKNKFFPTISKRDYSAYQHWLISENENSPSRIRRLKSAVSSMSNFVENMLDDEEEFEGFRSVVRKIENPAMQAVRSKTVWSDSELEALLSHLCDQKQFKKACMLALAMFSGRRKAELCRFRVADFDEANTICEGALFKTAETMKTKGFGRGKFIYCYTLAKGFRPYLALWMNERAESGIDSEWLFPSESDPTEQMSDKTLNSWATTFTKISGTDFYWHSLRHYFTTHLVRSGIPATVIQEIVGWSSSDMVKIYTDIDAEEQIGMYFEGGDIAAPHETALSDI